MKLVKAKEYDHRRLEATEMWCYRKNAADKLEGDNDKQEHAG